MTRIFAFSARRAFSVAMVLAFVACGPPDRRDDDDNNDVPATCGNGTLDSGEACDKGIASGDGSCPTSCDDGIACTTDTLQGSADACSATCVHAAITTCVPGDGCCASGCSRATDADCSDSCGNGKIEPGETCDKAIPAGEGSCPAGCNDDDACTTDVPSGSVEACSAACTHARITACVSGDGCCAPGCTSNNDSDCQPTCGNGIVEAGETCDGNCPASCNDGLPCTSDHLTGDAAHCNATCTNTPVSACVTGDSCCPAGCFNDTDRDCQPSCGNGRLETGETCDGNCPTSCADGDACTTDSMNGSVATCTVTCAHTPVTACVSNDGCCPAGCTSAQDADCGPRCGNGIVEPGELCDGNCPTTCTDLDRCTADTIVGSAATCDARCTHTAITQCLSGDGCCPGSCGYAGDHDCPSSGLRPGETCAAPNPVAPGTYPGQSLDGYVDDLDVSGNNCRSSAGVDGFYRVDVPAGKRLAVTVTPTSDPFDPVLSLFPVGTCSNVRCSDSRDKGFGGQPETAVWFNQGTTTAPMEIWVDEYQDDPPRTYDLAVGVDDPAPGETCANAVLVNASGTLASQTTSVLALGTSQDQSCAYGVSARRIYAIDVPAGMHAEIGATPDSATDLALDLIVGTAADCQSLTTVCAGSSDNYGKGAAESVGWSNAGTQTSRIYVVASSPGAGTFSLTLAVAAPIAGDNCGNAISLGAPVSLAGQTMVGALNDFSGNGYCDGESGPDRVWVTNVPAGQRLTVTAKSATAAAPLVTLVPGTAAQCTSNAPVCVQPEGPSNTVGATTVVRWTNATGASAPTYVRLDGLANASYDLTTALDSPPGGETCLSATPVTMPSTVSGTTVGATDDYAASGGRSASGCADLASFDRVYVATVPAGKTLVGVLHPEAGFDATLNLVAGSASACDGAPRKCAAGSDSSSAGGIEAVRYVNGSASAQQAYLIVDAKSVGAAGGYSLDLTTDPLPGDTCASATTLTLPANLPSETLAGYGADVVLPSGDCNPFGARGNDHVYALTVPSGKTLTVNVTPATSNLDPILALVPAPASACANPTSCYASADAGIGGSAEVVTYANNTTAPVQMFLVVSHYTISGNYSTGSYSLTATLSP